MLPLGRFGLYMDSGYLFKGSRVDCTRYEENKGKAG